MSTTLEAPVRAKRKRSRPVRTVPWPPPPTDLAALAERREARWQKRFKRLMADTTLDPRLRKLYLDRTILNTREQKLRVDVNAQRIVELRQNRHVLDVGDEPHPSVYPDADTIEGVRFGVEDQGVESGRLDEWRVESGRAVFNATTGQLEKARPGRHGRPKTSYG